MEFVVGRTSRRPQFLYCAPFAKKLSARGLPPCNQWTRMSRAPCRHVPETCRAAPNRHFGDSPRPAFVRNSGSACRDSPRDVIRAFAIGAMNHLNGCAGSFIVGISLTMAGSFKISLFLGKHPRPRAGQVEFAGCVRQVVHDCDADQIVGTSAPYRSSFQLVFRCRCIAPPRSPTLQNLAGAFRGAFGRYRNCVSGCCAWYRRPMRCIKAQEGWILSPPK